MAAKNTKEIVYPFVLTTRFGKVKIYRNGTQDKREYIVSWVNEEGRQRKSFSEESHAHQRAEEIQDDYKRGLVLRQNISSEKAARLSEYEKLLTEHGATIGDAVQYFLVHKAKQASKQIMAAEAVVEYLKKFPDQKSRHYTTAKSNLTKFGRHFLKTLDRITVKELDTYFKSLSEVGKTRNHHLGYVRTFFKWAQEWGGYLPEGKLEISKIAQYPEKKKRPDLYDPSDLEKLLTSATEDLVPYLAIGAFAGVRSSEICRLTWDDIRFDQKVIRLGPEITKTASGRLAIMPDNLVKWLKPHVDKKGMISPHREKDIHYFTRDIADKAGVPWKRNALRKGYISARMAQPNASAAVVAENCGNSPEVIKSNYQGLVLPDYADQWFGISPVSTV